MLQRLKELYLSNNWLPNASLKEFSYLKQLSLLDLGSNKLSADVDKWNVAFKSTSIKNLQAINTKGNLGLDSKASAFKTVLAQLFPSLKHVNPIDMPALS